MKHRVDTKLTHSRAEWSPQGPTQMNSGAITSVIVLSNLIST